MVLKPILGYFPRKRKTRVSSYIIWVCELFSTTLFIFLTTATWPFVLGILGAFGSTWLVNSALGCTQEHSVALGKPSRTYLKTYLKKINFNFLQFLSNQIFLILFISILLERTTPLFFAVHIFPSFSVYNSILPFVDLIILTSVSPSSLKQSCNK